MLFQLRHLLNFLYFNYKSFFTVFMLTLTFYKKYSKKSGLYQPYVVYVCAMKGGLDYDEYT